MTLGELTSGAAFQVAFEFSRDRFITERKRNDHTPWTIASRIDVLAGVVPSQAAFEVRREPGVVPRRLSIAAQHVDDGFRFLTPAQFLGMAYPTL